MTFIEIINAATNLGVIPVLLIIFVWYFMNEIKNHRAETQQWKEAFAKERDARESLLKAEMTEQSKRFTDVIERQGDTLKEIAHAMGDIERAIEQTETKVDTIQAQLLMGGKGRGNAGA